MNIAYIRVSSTDQNEGRQLELMKSLDIDKYFMDKCSAKDTNRPELKKLLEFVDSFYEFNKQLDDKQKQVLNIYIESFSRLARSTQDLLNLVEDLRTKCVNVKSIKENFDTSTPTGKLMLTMMAAINTFEREVLLERQREGIALAKKSGKYKGRKKIKLPTNWKEVYSKWKIRELTATEAMELLNLKKNTFYKFVKEYEDSIKNKVEE